MECVNPHCAGTLRTGQTTGFCSLCRLPASACTHCGCWNRPFALFCRRCGRAGTVGQGTDPVEPAALRSNLRRTAIPSQVTARPQTMGGFLWALGEAGDLFRLNPYAASGEQLGIYDRFWAEAQPHAFCVARLHLPFVRPTPPFAEDCAVIATADRILLAGLYSRQRRTLTPAAGEIFLVNSRDEHQFVAAAGSSVYALSRRGELTSFCHFSLNGGEVHRLTIAHGNTPLCGPVLLGNGEDEHLVLWSQAALWLYSQGTLTAIPVPEGVTFPTASTESSLGLPPGHSPALPADDKLFLACNQFGRPALLRLAPGHGGWSTTLIAVSEAGTLSQSTAGQPLLATSGRVLACTGPALRTLIQDNQIAARFPAWNHQALTVFFCEADYQGRKQWLKAYEGGAELPISWEQPSGAEIHACDGFWTMGTALCTLCVVGERALRTEFISWCV